MKKAISAAVALILTLSLAGCGNSGVSQESYDALANENATLQENNDTLQSEKDNLQGEYDTLLEEKEELQSDYDHLNEDYLALEASMQEEQELAEIEAEEPEEELEQDTGEYDPMVENIDLTCDDGNLKYVSYETANPGLTDEENALVFVFEFTNYTTKPAETQSTFTIEFYQNGAELSDSTGWSSTGGDQYDLCGAYFDNAMKDGTVTFGKIVVPEDDSPITIMVSVKHGDEDDYQMMEVSLTAEGESSEAEVEPAEEIAVSVEEIDALLQGVWALDESTFTFDAGNVTVSSAGQLLEGTYEVNTAESQIDASFTATDGTVNIHLPYTYENGTLKLYNNGNDELVKQ